MKNVIKINIDGYLVGFVLSMIGTTEQPAAVSKKNIFGALLSRLVGEVPENCCFTCPVVGGKQLLELDVSSLCGRGHGRKRGNAYYYLPLSRQREFETTVREVFDELFFQTIEIGREYSHEQYVKLIESFCLRYHIDFAENFESLKKKHYRMRQVS